MRLCFVKEFHSFLHHLPGHRPVRSMVREHWEIIHMYLSTTVLHNMLQILGVNSTLNTVKILYINFYA